MCVGGTEHVMCISVMTCPNSAKFSLSQHVGVLIPVKSEKPLDEAIIVQDEALTTSYVEYLLAYRVVAVAARAAMIKAATRTTQLS